MITVASPDGVPEVEPGSDLAGLLLAALQAAGLRLADGDVVAVTSKVVSKSEGRLVEGVDRDGALHGESERVVARRGPTTIVRHRLGLTIAAAGIDRSNVAAGTMALLPLDPDRSARSLRDALARRAGVNVAVIVTDTAGRAWRTGQTDLAIGAAGLVVLDDHAGRVDRYGNLLEVTAPAVADELAGAAELAQGKLAARPFALLRGRPDLVLAADDHGLGAVALVRPEGADLFGYGAREAVLRALGGAPADRAPFGTPVPPDEVLAAIADVLGIEAVLGQTEQVLPVVRVPGPLTPSDSTRLAVLLFAHGWELGDTGAGTDAAGDAVWAHPHVP